MKNFILVCAIALGLTSCTSSKYPHLGDGVFADIQTTKGNMVVKLTYKETPNTVANFVSLAEGTNTLVADSLKGKPYYDGVIFHRVIQDFMIQGGDPTGTGMGSPGYKFEDEIVDTLRHSKKGILSMANAGPGTNGSQFFITHVPTPHLDGRHTVFGEVVEGVAVIDSIASVKTGPGNRPETPVVINKIVIIKNGKEAKSFDAAKVFSNYMQEVTRKEKEREEKMEAAKAAFTAAIIEDEAKATVLPSGLKILFTHQGEGPKPNHTQSVLINYAGYLTDGTLFDTSWLSVAETYGAVIPQKMQADGYKPFAMPYNESATLIPGFKEAMLSMKVGDKVRIFIPSFLGYGER